MDTHLFIFALGVIVGIIVAVKVGLGTTISNEIGKIKRNDGVVNVDQKTEPRNGLFKRIFKRK